MQQTCITDDFVLRIRHHEYHSISMVCRLSHIMLGFFWINFFSKSRRNTGFNAHFNLIPTRLFCAPKTCMSGNVPPPPPPLPKTLLSFSEPIQVKFFWKLVQKWVSEHNFSYLGNNGWRFKVVHFGNPYSKQTLCLIKSDWACGRAWSRFYAISMQTGLHSDPLQAV